MIRIGSLFSGIGGLELGIEAALAEAGIIHRVVWQVEYDPFPRSILARHWPEADRSITDVRQASSANLAPIDLLVGGYPCQPFSHAGKRAGADDERHLWPEVARLLRDLRPRYAMFENVAGHLSLGFAEVLGDLAALGYDARWEVLRASDVGAPHRRERLFIVVADADGPTGAEQNGQPNQPRQQTSRRRDPVGCAQVDRAGAAGAQPIMGRDAHGLSHRLDRIPDRWPAPPGQAQHEWEPPRTAKGVPRRAGRLKALGNAVVPAQGRKAARRLLVPLLKNLR